MVLRGTGAWRRANLFVLCHVHAQACLTSAADGQPSHGLLCMWWYNLRL